MKLRKILILSLGMALCAAGGVGTALAAVTRNKASSSSSSSFDKAIYLYWDQNSGSSAHLDDMTQVTETAQYRYLEVAPRSSATLTGTVTVSFTLAAQQEGVPEGKTATTKGINVKVYALDNQYTYDDYEAHIPAEALFTLNGSDSEALANSTSFAISTGEQGHETLKKYAIEVTCVPAGVLSTEQVSATLTVSQSFAA